MSKTILLDIDGVLADFVHGYSVTANNMYGSPVINAMTCSTRSLKKLLNLTGKEDKCIREVIKLSNTFWLGLPDLATYREIDQLVDMQDVIFVTLRPAQARSQTRGWLNDRHLLQPCLHVTNKTPLLQVFQEGGYVLDDHAPIIDRMMAYCYHHDVPVWKPYLLNREYNKDFVSEWDLPEKLLRVSTIEEFLKEVE